MITNAPLHEDLVRAADDDYINACCDMSDAGIEWVDFDTLPDYTFDLVSA